MDKHLILAPAALPVHHPAMFGGLWVIEALALITVSVVLIVRARRSGN